MATDKPRIAVRASRTDYRVIRHADVFLLMPQNDEARNHLENYRFSYDIYGEGDCVERPFNKNGGMIIRAGDLKGWLEVFADDGYEIDDEL